MCVKFVVISFFNELEQIYLHINFIVFTQLNDFNYCYKFCINHLFTDSEVVTRIAI